MELSYAIIDAITAASASAARARGEPLSPIYPEGCYRNAEVFDELDYLDAGEFAAIYALYLLGAGIESEVACAIRRALSEAFQPIELMADDLSLHFVLAKGAVMWRGA
jgi:hypothetical protein